MGPGGYNQFYHRVFGKVWMGDGKKQLKSDPTISPCRKCVFLNPNNHKY